MIRKPPPLNKILKNDSSGVALLMALFMVLLITFIVNEVNFETSVEYVVNSQNLHRLKAYYAAKSAVDLAKLRIRVYQKVLSQVGDQLGEQAQMLSQIYQFPFSWPLPTLGDMNSVDKDAINKVSKEALMEAEYDMTISTEDKLNINDLNSPSEAQRKKVYTKLEDLFKSRLEQDDEWAKDNRDMRYEEIINNIKDFVDPDTQSDNGGDEASKYGAVKELDRDAEMRLPPNRYFRSIEEVRMVPGVTDEVFAILEPVITIFGPFGINPNYADQQTLKSLHRSFTDDVVAKIMSRRDNPNEGGPFKDADDFFGFATASGAKLTEEDQTNIPLLFTTPCHFRIVAGGRSGKVQTTITAVTYDINCQIKDVAAAVKKEDDEKNKAQGNPNQTSPPPNDPNQKNQNPKKPDLPKGPPRIIYWNER
jgi:general secretion pathway protein K